MWQDETHETCRWCDVWYVEVGDGGKVPAAYCRREQEPVAPKDKACCDWEGR